MKNLYSTVEYPNFVGHHGAWDIYANDEGLCVALPVDPDAGHKSCVFGRIGYARRILEGAK